MMNQSNTNSIFYNDDSLHSISGSLSQKLETIKFFLFRNIRNIHQINKFVDRITNQMLIVTF